MAREEHVEDEEDAEDLEDAEDGLALRGKGGG
jgi:hypothetical protein